MDIKEQLKKESAELYQAYNNSLNIAVSEWLPSVETGKDSYNSLPHIRNLENLLNNLLTKCEKENLKIKLNAAEIYVILSAILFHDMGKSTWLSSDKSKEHGSISKEKIYKSARTFGIPSNELAKTIGKICEYHSAAPKERKDIRHEMSISEIDPYGEVNELLLATLLTFVDYLDGTYTRAIPDYIADSLKIEIVGAFRSLIRGVNIDLKAQMVYTNLGDVKYYDGQKDLETDYLYSYNDKCNNTIIKGFENTEFIKSVKDKKNMDINVLESLITEDKITVEEILERHLKGIKTNEPVALLQKINSTNKLENKSEDILKDILESEFKTVDWLIVLQILHAKRKSSEKENKSSGNIKGWKLEVLLQAFMSNILDNTFALSSIASDLSVYGLPVNAWLINYKDHLYNFKGQETFEPIFNKKMLKDVAYSMWFLSSRTFGSSYIDYEDLASHLREPDIRKVMMAVKRLSIITSDKNGFSYIVYQANHWKWSFDSSGNCRIMHLADVEDIIEELGDYSYEFKE